MRSIVWFRGKDLRVEDHAPLHQACRQGEVIPVFVLDPFFFAPVKAQGIPHRMSFLLESLKALAQNLASLGSHLVVVEGPCAALIPELAHHWRVDQVLAQRWSEPFGVERDRRIATVLGREGIPFRLFEGETLAPPGTLRTRNGGPFHVFTSFARAFRRQFTVGRPLAVPKALPPVPEPGAGIPGLQELGLEFNPRLLKGGETVGRRRLGSFLAGGLTGYRLWRDRMDWEGTSRLSADLHFGTLSVRSLWDAVSRAEAPPEDILCFQNQLLWREFAHHLLADQPWLCRLPFRDAFARFPWRCDAADRRAWADGRTGYPLVDAAARQLLAQGFVHNRARMVAASFLTKHLLQDYRFGEAHYLRWLVDGDWANNNLGWQWSAGCGVDAQPWFRVFNPILQGERFDPVGSYVKHWVPELENLPAKWIHRPWEAPDSLRRTLDYPRPVIDHALARARFLEVAKANLARNGARSG